MPELRIPLSEQIKWLEQHREMFVSHYYGNLYDVVRGRLINGSKKFGDTMFFMKDEELWNNEIEEEADRLLYKCARWWRREARADSHKRKREKED